MTADFWRETIQSKSAVSFGELKEKGGAPIRKNPVLYPQFVIGTYLCVNVTHTLLRKERIS
jgi:hypothetical protein